MGLFWFADGGVLITYKIPCDADGLPEVSDLPYNSHKGNSFTHKATWEEAAKGQPCAIRSRSWNFFPRGRVEIKAGKATVYHNPALTSSEFEQRIRDEFALDVPALSVRLIPDHSNHYMAADDFND